MHTCSGTVAQSSAESDYNAACTTRMTLVHYMILNNELTNKDPNVVTEQAPIIILDIKSYVCMADNDKDCTVLFVCGVKSMYEGYGGCFGCNYDILD